MKRTGVVYHPDYLKHKTGYFHPESPERLLACLKALKDSEYADKLHTVDPTPATVDQVAYVHELNYIETVEKSSETGMMLDYDTVISKDSFNIALLAVGGALRAADAIIDGQIDNAFGLIRPPGHHATPNKGMGFCLFNNIAITARYLQKERDISKVLIVDWDLHHGNGTQEVFYDDDSVFYFSVHQFPYYPGTGAKEERGIGDGLEFTLNVPMQEFSSTEDYLDIFENVLKPEALKFNPDFILISAGFDAHENDPLGRMNLTADGFAELTKIVCKLADETCDGKIISLLEGGYNLNYLSASVVKHIGMLLYYDETD